MSTYKESNEKQQHLFFMEDDIKIQKPWLAIISSVNFL